MAATAPQRAPAKRNTAAPVRRSEPGSGKLAASVADRIVEDVVARGWPVGEVLGSEAALLERYGVSRAVFREAVRLVEHQQVARMRRGPGGGLVVCEPSVALVSDAVVVYVCRADARLDDVFDVRLILEEMVADLATARLEEDDMRALRALVERERRGEVTDRRELHALLGAISRNPALELFVDILNRVSNLYLADSSQVVDSVRAASADAHARIVEAVLAGDTGLARRRMRRHLEAEVAWLRGRRSASRVLDTSRVALAGGGEKGAEVVAEDIFRQVVAKRWPVGHLIGSEADLIARYDVSRAVVREAVRLLEHHGVASMRRGPGGGLFVAEPGVETVSDAVALYLDRQGMDVASLAEVRTGLELVIVDRVATRPTKEVRARLQQALDAERSASDEDFIRVVGHDIHAVLARLTGNPVLELLMLVLLRLSRLHQVNRSGQRPAAVIEEVSRTHGRIVEAVAAGDRDVARHRMRRHLQALRPFLA